MQLALLNVFLISYKKSKEKLFLRAFPQAKKKKEKKEKNKLSLFKH